MEDPMVVISKVEKQAGPDSVKKRKVYMYISFSFLIFLLVSGK